MLKAEHISRTFSSGKRRVTAVTDASLTLAAGELAAIVGRSGSGKSTLLNMLGGLLKPDTGDVRLGSVSLNSLSDAELSALRGRKIGFVPQGGSLLSSLSVFENLSLPFAILKEQRNVEQRARELLEQMHIGHLLNAYPAEISGGEARRAAIARALMPNPEFLLADEPTSDLDDENTRDVIALLADIAKCGTGVLFVTHDREAAAAAVTLYRMNAGQIEQTR